MCHSPWWHKQPTTRANKKSMRSNLLWVDPIGMDWPHIAQFCVPENCDHLQPMYNRLDHHGTAAIARPIRAMCHNRPTSSCTTNSLVATYRSYILVCPLVWYIFWWFFYRMTGPNPNQPAISNNEMSTQCTIFKTSVISCCFALNKVFLFAECYSVTILFS